MIDVKDRVPTRAGRTKITHEDGTVEYVILERADEPIENGTPLNKVLFDSIQDDLDDRVLVADKATVEQAEQGEVDNKYMTPAKVKSAIKAIKNIPYLIKSEHVIGTEQEDSENNVNISLANYSGSILIKFSGKGRSTTYFNEPYILGTGIDAYYSQINNGNSKNGDVSDETSIKLLDTSFGYRYGFFGELYIDFDTKMFKVVLHSNQSNSSGSLIGPGITTYIGNFSTLTTFRFKKRFTTADCFYNYEIYKLR